MSNDAGTTPGSAESGDAVVIPIGTTGRPGRGSGGSRPSSAARGLAPQRPTQRSGAHQPSPGESPEPAAKAPKAPQTPKTPKAQPRTEPAAEPSRAAGKRDTEQGATPIGIRSLKSESTNSNHPGNSGRANASSTRTQDREEGPGIPLSDWVSAIGTGAREVFGENWERRLAAFLAFLRHRLAGEYTVDEYGFDAELTQKLFMAILRPVAQKWFRIEVRGAENIPEVGGALVVSNHSGTLPVDGLMTMFSTYDSTGRHLRPLGADLVFSLPVVSQLARKGGATLACQPDAERLLRNGELVGVWPEGFKGIGKPFSERYKLQRFGRGGFVSAALRTGVPIVPLSVVGAEEIYPMIGNLKTLARILGLPYLPITPTFPLLGPLGLIPLPSKWLLEFGEPIRTDSYDEVEAEDPMLVFEVTDQVRESIQHTLYTLLNARTGVFS